MDDQYIDDSMMDDDVGYDGGGGGGGGGGYGEQNKELLKEQMQDKDFFNAFPDDFDDTEV